VRMRFCRDGRPDDPDPFDSPEDRRRHGRCHGPRPRRRPGRRHPRQHLPLNALRPRRLPGPGVVARTGLGMRASPVSGVDGRPTAGAQDRTHPDHHHHRPTNERRRRCRRYVVTGGRPRPRGGPRPKASAPYLCGDPRSIVSEVCGWSGPASRWWRWVTVRAEVKLERPQRSEDERA
jgi:hypothetical protein